MNALVTLGSVVTGSPKPVPGDGARVRSGYAAPARVQRSGADGLAVSRVERALPPVLASAHATRLFPIDGGDATGLPPRAAPV